MGNAPGSGSRARISAPAWAMKTFLRLSRRKRIYASVEGLMSGIAQTRRAGPDRPSAAMQQRVSVRSERVGGCEVYTLEPRSSQAGAQVILYLHGGAYCRPITRHHWSFLQWLALERNCTLVVPLYPLAPESTCVDTVRAVREVHAWASLRHGAMAAFMGDSAGAGLALALCQQLQAEELPLPHRLVLITPFVDVRLTHPEVGSTEIRDPMLGIEGVREAGRLYAGALDVGHPHVSPSEADPRGLPPMQIFVGTDDILSHDAIGFAEKAHGSGCRVDLHVGPGMMHVWPLMPIPEARRSRLAISRFLNEPEPRHP